MNGYSGDGPAYGMKSIDFAAEGSRAPSDHDSVGLSGQGMGRFEWRKSPRNATSEKLNTRQNIYRKFKFKP